MDKKFLLLIFLLFACGPDDTDTTPDTRDLSTGFLPSASFNLTVAAISPTEMRAAAGAAWTPRPPNSCAPVVSTGSPEPAAL